MYFSLRSIFATVLVCQRGFPRAGEYSVTLQTSGDFIGAVTVKVFTVDSLYCFSLFWVDDKITFGILGIA